MNIQVIALDLDGTTLLSDHKSISHRMKLAIETAISHHISVVPTSGRPHSFLPSSVTALQGMDYVITSNGAVIYSLKRQRPVYASYIKAADAFEVLRSLPKEVLIEYWSGGSIYFSSSQGRELPEYPLNERHKEVLKVIGVETDNLADYDKLYSDTIEKINLPYIPSHLKSAVMSFLTEKKFSLLDTGEGVEIMNTGVTKAFGLNHLCRYLFPGEPVGLENILAIGDSENDAEMIQSCGIGVAMGNADAMLKRCAKYVTLSNADDGAALAIEKYALNVQYVSGDCPSYQDDCPIRT